MGKLRKALRRFNRRHSDRSDAAAPYKRIHVKELKKRLNKTKPTCSFSGYEVWGGDLDLGRLTIDTAVDLQRCTFRGRVNLSYCEFKQAVNFSGSTFCEEFNSGRDPEVHTIYRKDLICNGTHFEKDASFTGARVEGDAYFSKDTKQSPGYKDTIFSGPVSFHAFKCSGNGKFVGARFESGEVADLRSATFGGKLDCTNAVFRGPVLFNALKVGGAAYFKNAHFLSIDTEPDLPDVTSASERYAVSFRHATFDRHLVCQKALFKGPVSFNSVQCKSTGFCQNMRLEGQRHNFRYASFEGNLRCHDSTFKGELSDFNYLKVGGNFSLDRAFFDTDMKMGHATVLQKLSLQGSCFRKRIGLYDSNIRILELLNINHPASIKVRNTNNDLITVKFSDYVNVRPLTGTGYPKSVGANEDMSRGIFGGVKEWFTSALSRRRREKQERNEQKVRDLADKLCPWQGHSPDLTATTFTRFHGGRHELLKKELALKLIAGQDPTTFSRDPYLQMEEFYRRSGNETAARSIYRRGREDLRENAQLDDSNIRWSRSRNFSDWLWKTVTGYGVDLWRLFLIAGGVLLFGTLMFWLWPWPSDALDPVRHFVNNGPGGEESPNLFLYSLDLFLPLVNLHLDNKWAPNGLLLQMYADVHTLVGWLIVPLLVASLAGIMRR